MRPDQVRLQRVGFSDQASNVAGKIKCAVQRLGLQGWNLEPRAVGVRVVVTGKVDRCPGKLASSARSTLLKNAPGPYPERLGLVAEGQFLCEHVRYIDRSNRMPRTIYDWRHDLAVVQRKPGALRNGAPFMEMPEAFRNLQVQLLKRP